MFQTRSEYDRGVNTFSPEGRLFQVEYAIEAIKLGSTAIAIKTREGVVLAVEKRATSPLMDASSAGEDRGDRRARGVRGERADGGRVDDGGARTGGVPESLLYV